MLDEPIDRKLLSHLVDFGCYEKSFFRKCWVRRFKKIVKNDICWCKSWCKTTRNKRTGSCILFFFKKKLPSKLEIQCTKHACIFYLILHRIPSCLALSVNNGVDGRKGGTKQTKSVKTDGSYLKLFY